MIYLEYKLKEKFGWTQQQLDSEDSDTIDHYVHIMGLEEKEKERRRAASKA